MDIVILVICAICLYILTGKYTHKGIITEIKDSPFQGGKLQVAIDSPTNFFFPNILYAPIDISLKERLIEAKEKAIPISCKFLLLDYIQITTSSLMGTITPRQIAFALTFHTKEKLNQ